MEMTERARVDSPVGGDDTVLPGDGEATLFRDAHAEAETNLPPQRGDSEPINESARRVFGAGDVFFHGRYRIDAPVESGMEAAAYRGTRLDDGTQVFVKHQWRQRSKHRASILEKLLACDHVGCVRLLDFDVTDRPIEIYEWVDGVPFAHVLRSDIVFTEAQIREIVRALAEALQYLHVHAGTAHRDVKPSNILVTEPNEPRIKLADYGVMTLVEAGGATTFAGTKKYAPPEALRWSLSRSELMAYDWWSLGRVVQEIADGVHPYDRIALRFADRDVDPDQMDAVWSDVLSEQSRATYGRAGQVEQSSPAWRGLLRGLLTTDREKRWGYAETLRWLAGETLPDAYDESSGASWSGSAADAVLGEILRLCQPENWEDACRIGVESTGVIGQVRTSDNKRARTRLLEADKAYDALVDAGAADVAEEVFTALALRAVGGDRVPLTLRGCELEPELLVSFAAAGKPRMDRMFWAFMRPEVVRVMTSLSPDMGARFADMAARYRAVTDVLESWKTDKKLLAQTAAIAVCALQSRTENEAQIDNAKKFLASSANRMIDDAFRNAGRGDAQAAALVFTFERAADFRYDTVASVERREREKSDAAAAERARLERERAAEAERRRRAQEERAKQDRLERERVRQREFSKARDVIVLVGIIVAFVIVANMGGKAPSAQTSGYIYQAPQQLAAVQPEVPTSATAIDLVREYYALWDRGDYSTMYGMLASPMQASHPYADYVKFHSNVLHIEADASSGSTPNAVVVQITSNDRELDGSVTQSHHVGEWIVAYENGSPKLYSQTIHQVGDSVTITPARVSVPDPLRSPPRYTFGGQLRPSRVVNVAPVYKAPTYTAPRYAAPLRPKKAPAKSVNQLDKEIDP
jgi:hypothetical protein